jgi:hypothetical protein
LRKRYRRIDLDLFELLDQESIKSIKMLVCWHLCAFVSSQHSLAALHAITCRKLQQIRCVKVILVVVNSGTKLGKILIDSRMIVH